MLQSPEMLRPGEAGASDAKSPGPRNEGVTDRDSGTSRDLMERVAALEERTRDKPKGLLDRIKEWSGVATAVLALLYTFPLGV
jgi:hypothetical protein